MVCMGTKKREVYLDNAATTPVEPTVLRAMLPYFSEKYGNPANLYTKGREAREAIKKATARVAEAIYAKPDEILFTNSATEADSLALSGIIHGSTEKRKQIIISNVEHKGILSIAKTWEREGCEIVRLPVDKRGLVSLSALKEALTKNTVLVSITMADSETGTLQPLAKIAKLIADVRGTLIYPYLHTDASQAAPYMAINSKRLGVDLLTLSAHKLGGPKGIGALFHKQGVRIRLPHRGTVNVPGIVGFGTAMSKDLCEKRLKSAVRIEKLRDRLEWGLRKHIPKLVMNGGSAPRLPNFLNVSILDVEGEALLLSLDELGIMIGTGSACDSESLEPSSVLMALGRPYEFIHGSLRFTLGEKTSAADIDYVIAQLPAVVERLRRISPLNLTTNQHSSMATPRAFVGGQTPHFLRKKKHPHG